MVTSPQKIMKNHWSSHLIWPLHRQHRDLFKKKQKALPTDDCWVFVEGFLQLKYLKHYHKGCEMNWIVKKIHLYNHIHTRALQLRQNLSSFKLVAHHLQIRLHATDETRALYKARDVITCEQRTNNNIICIVSMTRPLAKCP